MSGAPTSADDLPDAAALAAAGWSEAELTWEHVQVAAAEVLAQGKTGEAASLWQSGLELARETFGEDDPRLAASLANRAVGLRLEGDDAAAAALLGEALEVWDRAGPWIEALKPERRARSSLYHLRVETKYKGGYERHSRERYRKLAEEGRARTGALRDAAGAPQADLERWRRNRPAGYDDARKLLAAVVLGVSGR
jgi:hypothetical protein